ncbi:integrin alpha FG-GAP repeat-containing protein 2 [Lobosporangium transversale]|uniref:Uncharacterized protein n=1 Tax=Lobosporangium transversale TaxID=64571 RepID=A0A1Y2H273_9FUNG|nr:hypothetical protein BCR41DRAFT_417790 [Lobosporangium transversale]KAF9914531.1 integrin alpha FG-GAP repeat-containing protein 2 [Lobosporangium transversale]ORZ28648.1 hypothetical protein BCR41DRAFT_417790 [Lobosporangium transversale]|eukprot:XP_021886321.1 hypothetical protein BCR41DRAFT_417790 [Lobosporangium transversale]
MPTERHVSLVQKLRWHVSGNFSPTAFAIGDVDGLGDNAFVIGNLVGELFIFKGNNPDGLPWMTCKGLGTITAVAIGDIRNCGKNSIVVMSAEGLCHIFDIAELDNSRHGGHVLPSSSSTGANISSSHNASGSFVGGGPGGRSGQAGSIYSSTPLQNSYHAGQSGNSHPFHPTIPATPSIRPVPDTHHQHHNSHYQGVPSSHPYHGTPPLPPPQNTPHGSASSSISGSTHHHGHQQNSQTHTSNSTPIHSHAGSIHGGISGSNSGSARRASEAPLASSGPGLTSASASTVRTTAALTNSISASPIPTPTSHSHGGQAVGVTRSLGGNSVTDSPTGTPLIKPQQGPSSAASTRKQQRGGANRHGNAGPGKSQVCHVGGQRILDRPNLTLPVPVNINRAYIADIDGDGLNEIVLARTDRIMHSYSLQITKPVSLTATSSIQPSNQQLNLIKLVSRTSSISTLDSSGLLSPSDDRRETIIHYPSLSSMGRLHYAGSTSTVAGMGQLDSQQQQDKQDNSGVINVNDPSMSRLVLVEKKRWALDGQIHCLALTKDTNTGLPILLVAQPGLKFVMIDHTGNMSEPITQIQRNPNAAVNVVAPDTPTRAVGSGDVATEIICGSRFVNGTRKDIIGLMSMDGAIALHDLEENTVKTHDLDSTHKIFGFSKLNFGTQYVEQRQRVRSSRKSRRPSYAISSNSRFADEDNYDGGEEDDDDQDEDGLDTEDDGDTAAETQILRDHYANGGGGGDFSDIGDDASRRSVHSTHTKPWRSGGGNKASTSSMLISDSFGSRIQKNDIFVGCSWSGITFFIDQDFNTAQYDFDARVCAFGAGQYAVTPGRNEPCLFYVDFEDNIYVYYNLYIQTEPFLRFHDVVKADTELILASQKFMLKVPGRRDARTEKDEISVRSTEGNSLQNDQENDCKPDIKDIKSDSHDNDRSSSAGPKWDERDMNEFIHDSLYNVNRYEDEFQRLKRLTNLELAKRTMLLEEGMNKERERDETERKAKAAEFEAALAAATAEYEATLAAATAEAVRAETGDESAFIDSRSRPSLHVFTSEQTGLGRPHGQFPGHGISTSRAGVGSVPYTQTKSKYQRQQPSRQDGDDGDDNDRLSSPLSPVSSVSAPSTLPSTQPTQSYIEKRRSSLLIKDVLAHYEGKTTPPLKSPTSSSTFAHQSAKDHRSGASSSSSLASAGSSATLTNIFKRLSLKDKGGNVCLSRSSSSGSASGASNGSQSTIIQSHSLLGTPTLSKGKASAVDSRIGKPPIRVNRPSGISPRPKGIGTAMTGRKPGAKSKLFLQQDREESTDDGDVEDGVDEQGAPSEDDTVETDGDQLIEFDRSSRKDTGGDEFHIGSQKFDDGSAAVELYGNEGNNDETSENIVGALGREEGRVAGEVTLAGIGVEEDITTGVYTPSTISPIPSPRRLYSNNQQHGSSAEPSASLDSTAFMLAKSLLSPSTQSVSSGSTGTTTIGATTVTLGNQGKNDHNSNKSINHGPQSSSYSHGSHLRQRSAHGLLDVTGTSMREYEANPTSGNTAGFSSDPFSTGLCSAQGGQRFTAASLLNTGSDVGEIAVPDIKLVAASLPTQPVTPLSTSESSSLAQIVPDDLDQEDSKNGGEMFQKATIDELCNLDLDHQPVVIESDVCRQSAAPGPQGGMSESDTTAAEDSKSSKSNNSERFSRSGESKFKESDMKLMQAPLPRSNQHYRKQQHQQSQGQEGGGMSSSAHVSFSDTHPNSVSASSGGEGDGVASQGGGVETFHFRNDGLGRSGFTGKSSSTTSSATVSDFGSGPSSPLASNVNAAHAILSNPSFNSYKGFSVLSLPLTSPSASTATAQQHQYFSPSHYHHYHVSPTSIIPSHLGLSTRGGPQTHDRALAQEDDRMSIRSRTSTFHDTNENPSTYEVVPSAIFVNTGGATVGVGEQHQQNNIYGMSPTSTLTSNLTSDSLVRRLEDLQQQDRDLEERQQQRQREKKLEKEKENSKENTRATPTLTISQSSSAAVPTSRPSSLSRANSGASVQSVVSHHGHRAPIALQLPLSPHSSSSAPSVHLSGHGSITGAGTGPASSSSGIGSLGSISGSTHERHHHHTWEEDPHEAAKRLRSRPGLGADR